MNDTTLLDELEAAAASGSLFPAAEGAVPPSGASAAAMSDDDLGVDPRFRPGPFPRVIDGVLVPAESARRYQGGMFELVPASSVEEIRRTRRAVGVWLRGRHRWVLLFVSDDSDEVDDALQHAAEGYAAWATGKGRR